VRQGSLPAIKVRCAGGLFGDEGQLEVSNDAVQHERVREKGDDAYLAAAVGKPSGRPYRPCGEYKGSLWHEDAGAPLPPSIMVNLQTRRIKK